MYNNTITNYNFNFKNTMININIGDKVYIRHEGKVIAIKITKVTLEFRPEYTYSYQGFWFHEVEGIDPMGNTHKFLEERISGVWERMKLYATIEDAIKGNRIPFSEESRKEFPSVLRDICVETKDISSTAIPCFVFIMYHWDGFHVERVNVKKQEVTLFFTERGMDIEIPQGYYFNESDARKGHEVSVIDF